MTNAKKIKHNSIQRMAQANDIVCIDIENEDIEQIENMPSINETVRHCLEIMHKHVRLNPFWDVENLY